MAALLSRPLQAPVIDITGLKGRFDIPLNAAPYMTPEVMSAKSPAELIGVGITAMHAELGLKVETKKVPVEMIVIDRVLRTPVEN